MFYQVAIQKKTPQFPQKETMEISVSCKNIMTKYILALNINYNGEERSNAHRATPEITLLINGTSDVWSPGMTARVDI